MKRFYIIMFLIALVSVLTISGVNAISGEDILRKVDTNMKYDTIIYTGKMEIYINAKAEPRVKIMKAQAMGDQKAFVEFLNPEDRNTRYLKIDKKMWIYDGENENVFLISGHMLKQGMMGSDVSYEDALESDSLYEKYNIEISGTEKVDDRVCTIITLTAKVKKVSYEKRKMWIDTERFIALKVEMYAKSGKLLKESRTLEVKKIGERYFPVKSVISDKLRQGSKTILSMTDLQLNAPLDENLFTMQNLQK